jgi:hypothetical protein
MLLFATAHTREGISGGHGWHSQKKLRISATPVRHYAASDTSLPPGRLAAEAAPKGCSATAKPACAGSKTLPHRAHSGQATPLKPAQAGFVAERAQQSEAIQARFQAPALVAALRPVSTQATRYAPALAAAMRSGSRFCALGVPRPVIGSQPATASYPVTLTPLSFVLLLPTVMSWKSRA